MKPRGITFTVKVKPNAGRDEVTQDGRELYVRVAVPPADGKANARLIELVSGFFDVPKSAIKLLKGASSRNKIIEVAGLDGNTVRRL